MDSLCGYRYIRSLVVGTLIFIENIVIEYSQKSLNRDSSCRKGKWCFSLWGRQKGRLLSKALTVLHLPSPCPSNTRLLPSDKRIHRGSGTFFWNSVLKVLSKTLVHLSFCTVSICFFSSPWHFWDPNKNVLMYNLWQPSSALIDPASCIQKFLESFIPTNFYGGTSLTLGFFHFLSFQLYCKIIDIQHCISIRCTMRWFDLGYFFDLFTHCFQLQVSLRPETQHFLGDEDLLNCLIGHEYISNPTLYLHIWLMIPSDGW